MKLHNVWAIGSLLLGVPLFAAAQEGEEEQSPWAGKATLGYLATSGNTDNSNLNTGFEVSYSRGDWKHEFKALAINATEDKETTAEAYAASWKSERSFGESNYMFGQVTWRKDRFSGYDVQLSEAAGYGRRLIDTEKHKLNVEIGGGARQSDLADGTEEDEAIARGGLNYTWQISDTSAFQQDVLVEAGDENTYMSSVTKLSATLVGNLALVASYTVKHNTDVPPLTDKTDTFTAISLEYAF